MREKFINHIQKYLEGYCLGLLLLVSFLVYAWYTSRNSSIWWDESVYIDMGKYFISNGKIGMWESLRPPLLPIFYALAYSLNLPLVFVGQVIVLLASVGSIWLTYVIAEQIKKGTGLLAGVFLSITPVFFLFSGIPITDIISIFFVLSAVLLHMRKKDYFVGLCIALAFLLRFPQGLTLVSFGLASLYQTADRNIMQWFYVFFRRGLLLCAGFLTLAIPFFIWNYFLYHNIFEPLILGNAILGVIDAVYLSRWYYVQQLWATAPFLFGAILAPIALFFHKKTAQKSSCEVFVTVLIIALITMAYFFWQPHKELRYSIAFIPFLAVLSSLGVMFLIDLLPHRTVWLVVVSLGISYFMYLAIPMLTYTDNYPYGSLYGHLEGLQGSYLSTTPVPGALSDVKLPEIFSTATNFEDALNRRHDSVDGVIINSCDIFCGWGNTCSADVSIIQTKAQKFFPKKFETKIAQCTYSVFEK